MRSYCMLAVMVVLSACASTASDQPGAKFQNAVYRVGDEARPMVDMQAPSKPLHIYWFLSGR